MKKIAIIIALACGCGLVQAQDNYFFVNWDINTPMTNTNWIGSTSTRGIRAGYRAIIGPQRRFSAGLDVGWATFSEYKPTQTFQQEAGAITTDYFNYIYQLSLAASGQYYFHKSANERFFSYVGMGLGANQNKYTVFYNIYKDQHAAWGFLARPEAGILLRISTRKRIGLMAAVHYDYSTSKSNDYNYSSFSAVGVSVGIMSMQW